MYIDCVGMMRSGSTLQYNIVAEILELKDLGKRLGWESCEEFYKIKEKHENGKFNVFKNHYFNEEIERELTLANESILMYTYRDIRDVCISLMDKEHKTFEQIFNSGVLHQAIEQYTKIIHSKLKKYVQSYEIMFLNTKREIKEIARFLDVELTLEEIAGIYNKISFEAQKENIEKYRENSEYISIGNQNFNPESLLHLNHIKDGNIGKYKQRLFKSQIKQLEDTFGNWLQETGYKVENTQENQEPLRKYYSQHGEDYLLWNFFNFKKDGFFVEVGAFDGVHLSNTYSFERQGWKGVCVEPGQYFENCKNNRPNSICINAACVNSDDIKEITFYEEELGLLSSLEMSSEKKDDIEKRYENRKLDFSGHKEKIVKAQTLNSILEENGVSDIDFITIDVEGAEIEVLKGFDLKKYRPKVIILEANDEEHKQNMLEYMTVQNEYVFAKDVSVNLVFVCSEDDFSKVRDIEINCTIEKQLHPLGIKYTIPEYVYGLQYMNNIDIKNLFRKKSQELEQSEKALHVKTKELEEKQKVIEQKNSELSQKSQELEEKQKVIEQKNSELSQKSQELEQSEKALHVKTKELEKTDTSLYILMGVIKNITLISAKKNPIKKYKEYKNLISLYHELKGN